MYPAEERREDMTSGPTTMTDQQGSPLRVLEAALAAAIIEAVQCTHDMRESGLSEKVLVDF